MNTESPRERVLDDSTEGIQFNSLRKRDFMKEK